MEKKRSKLQKTDSLTGPRCCRRLADRIEIQGRKKQWKKGGEMLALRAFFRQCRTQTRRYRSQVPVLKKGKEKIALNIAGPHWGAGGGESPKSWARARQCPPLPKVKSGESCITDQGGKEGRPRKIASVNKGRGRERHSHGAETENEGHAQIKRKGRTTPLLWDLEGGKAKKTVGGTGPLPT